MKIALIVNSLRVKEETAKNVGDKFCQLANVDKICIYRTEKKGDAEKLACNAVESGFDCIIGMGGDGTLNEIVNGIKPEKNQQLIAGIIPCGTGNDFFTAQFGKFQESDFLKALANQNFKFMDVGKVSYNYGQRYFINIADVGFGAFTAKLLDQQRKAGLGGGLSYSTAILRAFSMYKKPTVVIQSDAFNHEGKLMMLTICNGSTFANGLKICPDAKPDDGMLNICYIGQIGFRDYLKNYVNLKKGIKISHAEVIYSDVRNISVRVLEGNQDFELDGETLKGELLEFTIVPSALRFINCGKSA